MAIEHLQDHTQLPIPGEYHRVVSAPDWPKLVPPDYPTMRDEMPVAMKEIIEGMQPGFHLFNQPTGAGKSYSIRAVLKYFHFMGWPVRPDGNPVRVLVLVKTKKLVGEYRVELPWLYHQEGRSDQPDSDAYCFDLGGIKYFADRGYNPVTEHCIKKCTPESKKKYGKDWSCKFLNYVGLYDKQQAVIACYEAFLNFGDRINDFDVIIVDEEVTSQLAKVYPLRGDHLDDWVAGMNAFDRKRVPGEKVYLPDHPARHLVEALHCLIDQEKSADELAAETADLPKHNGSIAGRVKAILGPHQQGVWAYMNEVRKDPDLVQFETATGKNVPMKLFAELARAIVEDNGAVQDWKGTLYLGVPKRRLIEQLSQKVVINLDATPCTKLLKDIFGVDNVKEMHKEITRHNINVVQFYSTNHTKSYLLGSDCYHLKRAVKAVNQCLTGLYTEGRTYKRPLIVLHKDVDKQREKLEEATKFDHDNYTIITYGNETRGLNEYSDADAIIFVGFYMENVSSLKAKVGCLRSSPRVKEHPNERYIKAQLRNIGPDWQYIPYLTLAHTPGTPTLARIRPGSYLNCPNEQDPVVQECLDWASASELIQGIGRTRPDQEGKQRVDVFIHCGNPFAGVPIDRLVDTETVYGTRKRPDNAERSKSRSKAPKVWEAEEAGCMTYAEVNTYWEERCGEGIDRKTYKTHSKIYLPVPKKKKGA